jgi:hypothetical protein
MGSILQNYYGFGGSSGGVSGSSADGTLATDQWETNPCRGKTRTLTAGQSITFTEKFAFSSVIVSYGADNGAGRIKIEKQTKLPIGNDNFGSLGSWVDHTGAWGGLQSDGGSDHGGGELDTDNGVEAGLQFSSAFNVLDANSTPQYYNIKITCTSGTVKIYDVGFDAGSIAKLAQGVWHSRGVYHCSWAEGGKNLGTHFNATSQAVWSRIWDFYDFDLASMKTLNNVNESYLETHWPTFVALWETASGGDAQFMVFGTHPSGTSDAAMLRDPDGNLSKIDDYWREYSAENQWAFVDIISSWPRHPKEDDPSWTALTSTSWLDIPSDDMHSSSGPAADGIHPNTVGASWWSILGFLAVKPAIDGAAGVPAIGSNYDRQMIRPMPGLHNAIKIQEGPSANAGPAHLNNKFLFITPPAQGGFVGITNKHTRLNGELARLTGFEVPDDSSTVNEVNILLHGQQTFKAAFHPTLHTPLGLGLWVTNHALCRAGLLVQGFSANYPTLIASGFTGQSTHPVFAVKVEGTLTTAGDDLWLWMPNGDVEYHQGSFKVDYQHEAPTANVTVVHPKTGGTIARHKSYADKTTGEAAVAVGESFWSEADETVFTRLS